MAVSTPTKSLWLVDVGVAFALLAVTVMTYALALRPLLAQRAAGREKTVELRKHRDEAAKLNTTLLTLKQRTIAARNQLAAATVALDSADGINRKIADLTALLTDCGMTLDDIQTGRILLGRRCDLVPIQVSGQGGYDGFTRFLHKLRADLPDICVADLDLRGTPEHRAAAGTFVFHLFWFAAPSLG